jgi:HD superfamily phosphodiesterase
MEMIYKIYNPVTDKTTAARYDTSDPECVIKKVVEHVNLEAVGNKNGVVYDPKQMYKFEHNPLPITNHSEA